MREKIDTTKLTKKVQEYIRSLEREIEDNEEMIEALRKENEPSNIFYTPSSIPQKMHDRVYLPKHTTVEFLVGEGDTHINTISVRVDGNKLIISGVRIIHITPRASNSCEILQEG